MPTATCCGMPGLWPDSDVFQSRTPAGISRLWHQAPIVRSDIVEGLHGLIKATIINSNISSPHPLWLFESGFFPAPVLPSPWCSGKTNYRLIYINRRRIINNGDVRQALCALSRIQVRYNSCFISRVFDLYTENDSKDRKRLYPRFEVRTKIHFSARESILGMPTHLQISYTCTRRILSQNIDFESLMYSRLPNSFH